MRRPRAANTPSVNVPGGGRRSSFEAFSLFRGVKTALAMRFAAFRLGGAKAFCSFFAAARVDFPAFLETRNHALTGFFMCLPVCLPNGRAVAVKSSIWGVLNGFCSVVTKRCKHDMGAMSLGLPTISSGFVLRSKVLIHPRRVKRDSF